MGLEVSKMGKLANLYYCSVVFANNMKHIHTHAYGKRFDRIHSICNEYYEKASNESDTFVELALEYAEKVNNSCLAAGYTKLKVSNQADYDYEQAMETVHYNIAFYVECMEEAIAEGQDEDVTNLLQEYMRYWKKENNYKNKARLGE